MYLKTSEIPTIKAAVINAPVSKRCFPRYLTTTPNTCKANRIFTPNHA